MPHYKWLYTGTSRFIRIMDNPNSGTKKTYGNQSYLSCVNLLTSFIEKNFSYFLFFSELSGRYLHPRSKKIPGVAIQRLLAWKIKPIRSASQKQATVPFAAHGKEAAFCFVFNWCSRIMLCRLTCRVIYIPIYIYIYTCGKQGKSRSSTFCHDRRRNL